MLNYRLIPNDDEWPLATVFDVTSKLVLIVTITMTSSYHGAKHQYRRISSDRKPFTSRPPLQQPNHIIARTALIPTVQRKTKMIIISLQAYNQVIPINKLDKQNH